MGKTGKGLAPGKSREAEITESQDLGNRKVEFFGQRTQRIQRTSAAGAGVRLGGWEERQGPTKAGRIFLKKACSGLDDRNVRIGGLLFGRVVGKIRN
jgi:hypothetical protein